MSVAPTDAEFTILVTDKESSSLLPHVVQTHPRKRQGPLLSECSKLHTFTQFNPPGVFF